MALRRPARLRRRGKRERVRRLAISGKRTRRRAQQRRRGKSDRVFGFCEQKRGKESVSSCPMSCEGGAQALYHAAVHSLDASTAQQSDRCILCYDDHHLLIPPRCVLGSRHPFPRPPRSVILVTSIRPKQIGGSKAFDLRKVSFYTLTLESKVEGKLTSAAGI